MKFLAPYAFWFALALPIVISFYLLKRKRVVTLVSSTLLWEKFLAETQANAPFQKLRRNWLLFLQLLLLALVVLGLARPYFAGAHKPHWLQVVLLDGSASMQSTDESPSRFEKAQREALQLVDALRDEDEMLVVFTAAATEVKQSPTGNKALLRRAIQQCAATDTPGRLKDALKLAETITRDRSDSEIHLFSDGAFGDVQEFANKGLNLKFHRVGQRGNNVAIVGLDIRENPEQRQQRAIYASVANFSSNSVQAELQLRFDTSVVEARAVTLAPGQSVPQIFVASQTRDGVFTVSIAAKDDLAVDNEASVVSLLPEPVRVLLVTRNNRFLEKALRAIPNVVLSQAEEWRAGSAEFDVVVLDNVTPPAWPAASVLAFHVAATNLFASTSRLEFPAIVDWKNTHPLLRYVSFDNVQIAESLRVTTPPWAQPVVEAQQTALVLAGELARRKVVWVGFDVLQSTWPLRVSFPIFIANAIEWLNPSIERASALTIRGGEPFHLAVTEPVTRAKIVEPDGTRRSLNLEAGVRELVVGGTTRHGTYHLLAGTNDVTFCVNLLDALESNTRPVDEIVLGKYSRVKAAALRPASMEMWRWIVAIALAVLLFEWWFYHRRTA
jgi:Ca-activated chloride channel homolog